MCAANETPGFFSYANDGFPNINIIPVAGLWGMPHVAAAECIDQIQVHEEITCYYGPKSWMRLSSANLNFEAGYKWLDTFLIQELSLQSVHLQRICYVFSTPVFLIHFLQKSKKALKQLQNFISNKLNPEMGYFLEDWIVWDLKLFQALQERTEDERKKYLDRLSLQLEQVFVLEKEIDFPKALSNLL